ncbi:hypothetical protein EVAR_67086_1 [Eumeta japonica]|uniref:UBE2O-like SH3-C domain-containing protein n=1 Tax=Eumeta variegata TaxID=151549 RepID=A0A4C1SAZ3_EUMVA|nr:hypothetical protein EVAR_67086_1 [Eumeta japonica]
MKADVKILGTKYVIKNVNAERLRIISNWQRDSAVCLDSWVGSIKDVEEKAVLRPTYRGETECSVYDLKDQPDFQYRPGTMVIRVANFVGEDAKSTAGQVIDNYIDGRVKVWWVDGHISLCWPQDLFEVGQLDQGNLSHASEDSWETESETSEVGCSGGGSSLKLSLAESDISTNIEKARVALARLQEIFNINPNLQNPETENESAAADSESNLEKLAENGNLLNSASSLSTHIEITPQQK